ncbi:unnamed protein product [Mytilus coruscus]|uniref:Uncharacterized protein n=1 Tax=Mytilus coruscus TaxID=42192 RepID=A0A6J8CWC2_MYTCO|nr:unnamed protein product [Mytilus coruscus]
MGSDIVAHRISIGLFYCKISSGCVKTVIKHTFSFNDVLFEICVNLEKYKLWILSKYKSYSDIVSFYMLLYSLLLICGDIESNPGPGGTSDPPEKTLSVFHGNIRSLRNKLNYITDIIEDFDIVFFTESHLDINVTDLDISLLGFETPVRKDRNANGGGIIMYYKSFINIIRRVDLEHDQVENKPTHFDTRTGNTSLLDPILVTDSIPVVDKDTIPIDRGISDHDETYVTIDCIDRGISDHDETYVTIDCIDRGISDHDETYVTIDCIDRGISDHDGTYVTIDCIDRISDHDGTYQLIVLIESVIISIDKIGDFDHDETYVTIDCIDRGISDHDGTYVKLIVLIEGSVITMEHMSQLPTREVVVRCVDKIWYNSNLRREMRKRDRFRKLFLRLKSASAELKFKQQRNKVNNLKKQAKQHFYAFK